MARKSNDEDDDYMSEKYLTECSDVRPGLIFQKATKRKHELKQNHTVTNQQSRIKPRKVLEKEQREEGLQKALGSENKGFAMLQKMGYKPGTSLGKAGTGRTEPIPVSVKVDRGGLGQDELLKQKRKEIAFMKVRLQEKRQRSLAVQSEEFLNYQRTKLMERQTNKDLYSSQKSCQQLDDAMGLDEPPEIWFWPETIQKSDDDVDEKSSSSEEEDDEDIKLSPLEKLEIITEYLRATHYFCVWCGTAFEDSEDLVANCPGKTSDDH